MGEGGTFPRGMTLGVRHGTVQHRLRNDPNLALLISVSRGFKVHKHGMFMDSILGIAITVLDKYLPFGYLDP